jgi:hypothetical protein
MLREKAYLEHCRLDALNESPPRYRTHPVESGQFSSYGLSGWRRLMDLLP